MKELLRVIKKHRILEATRKADKVMNKIEIGSITKLNDLVYGMGPWWKRRVEAQVKQTKTLIPRLKGKT